VDAEGLCVLCGAPARRPTFVRRAADAVGSVCSLLLIPAIVGVVVVGVVVAVGSATHLGAQAPAGVPAVGGLGPLSPLPQGGADAGGVALRLLVGAFVQSIVLALLVLIGFWFWRRRRQTESPAEDRRLNTAPVPRERPRHPWAALGPDRQRPARPARLVAGQQLPAGLR
jgi:hypothetical protein